MLQAQHKRTPANLGAGGERNAAFRALPPLRVRCERGGVTGDRQVESNPRTTAERWGAAVCVEGEAVAVGGEGWGSTAHRQPPGPVGERQWADGGGGYGRSQGVFF